MKDTIYSVVISLVIIAVVTTTAHIFSPCPDDSKTEIRVIEDAEQNAQEQLNDIRRLREEQEDLRRELMELRQLLEQYERGTLKSA